MAFKAFKYFLVHKDTRVFLFESQFQFLTELDCLRHYEKGILKSLFKFNRSQVDEIWCDLKLWGLLGRKNPVELIRILCGFGCKIHMNFQNKVEVLQKSFKPVTYYYRLMSLKRLKSSKHLYRELNLQFLRLADRLIIGSFYITELETADHQFPVFCQLLENDLCLYRNQIRNLLANLFYNGNNVIADCGAKSIVLVEYDPIKQIIRGSENEESLFYLGDAIKKVS